MARRLASGAILSPLKSRLLGKRVPKNVAHVCRLMQRLNGGNNRQTMMREQNVLTVPPAPTHLLPKPVSPLIPHTEGTFARRTPVAPSIQMNVPAIYHNALPPNITPSSSPGT